MFLPNRSFSPNQFESRSEKASPSAKIGGKSASTLNRILTAASDLFYRRGIRSVSVDEVIQAADVARPSLYRLFGSKDWLALAYLERHEEHFWNQLDAISALHPDDAKEQLLTLIDWIASELSHPGYLGCPVTNAAIEYHGEDHPLRTVAVAHKQAIRRHLRHMVEKIGVRNPTVLADQLLLLIEGAHVISALLPKQDTTMPLGVAARQLIAANIGEDNVRQAG